MGRELSNEEYGIFSIIRKIIQFSSWFVVLGIDAGIIRIIKINLNFYNWKKILKDSQSLSLILSIFPIILVSYLFKIKFLYLFITYLIIILLTTLIINNSFLRIMTQFGKAQFILHGWKILFFCLLLLVLTSSKFSFSLKNILFLLFFSYLIFCVISYFFTNNISNGKKNISLKFVIFNSIEFYFITLLTLFIIVFDSIIVAKYLGFANLGVYTAVSLIPITTFNLIGSSIGQVLMPSLKKNGFINRKDIIIIITIIGMILLLLLYYSSFSLNHIIFKGKFDDFNFLSVIFLIIGLLQYFGNIIYFYLGGTGTREELKLYSMFIFIHTIFSVILILTLFEMKLISSLYAVGISMIIVWLIRDLIGIYHIFKLKVY